MKPPLYLDTETTGWPWEGAEILELAILDSDGVALFNQRFKPVSKSWPEAEKIHGISPSDVSECFGFIHYIGEIAELLENQTVVCYNSEFDKSAILAELTHHSKVEELAKQKCSPVVRLMAAKAYYSKKGPAGRRAFLSSHPTGSTDSALTAHYGIDTRFPTTVWKCAMHRFAPYYGNWNEYYQSYTWTSLEKAAKFCGHCWTEHSHSALGDCMATRTVWEWLERQIQSDGTKRDKHGWPVTATISPEGWICPKD